MFRGKLVSDRSAPRLQLNFEIFGGKPLVEVSAIDSGQCLYQHFVVVQLEQVANKLGMVTMVVKHHAQRIATNQFADIGSLGEGLVDLHGQHLASSQISRRRVVADRAKVFEFDMRHLAGTPR